MLDKEVLGIMVSLSAAVAIGMRSIEALIGKTLFHRREDERRANGFNEFTDEDRRKLTAVHEAELERKAIYREILNTLRAIAENTSHSN